MGKQVCPCHPTLPVIGRLVARGRVVWRGFATRINGCRSIDRLAVKKLRASADTAPGNCCRRLRRQTEARATHERGSTVPANRSRTMEWRRCLRQIHERNGTLEIAVAREYGEGEDGRHLVWRVHVLGVNDDEVIIEAPTTLGKTIHLKPGIKLVAILAIGQNRWMFNTKIIGTVKHRSLDHRTT